MTKRIMSDAEIRRRKKAQGTISHATGTLGLTALGGTLLATKTGSKGTKAAFKLVGRKRPKALKPKNIKRGIAPILATGAGIGGAGSFNFAAYTNAESRKRKMATPVKKARFSNKHRSTAQDILEQMFDARKAEEKRRKRKVKKSDTVSAFGVDHG
jgi:hypothetical protein